MFEDEFARVQTDAVVRAFDLVGGEVDGIYLYLGSEGARTSFNAFFRCGSIVDQARNLGLADGGPSTAETRAFLRAGLDTVAEVAAVCERHGQPVPTEVRVTYSVADENFTSEVRYDRILSEEVGVREVVLAWMDEVRASLARP